MRGTRERGSKQMGRGDSEGGGDLAPVLGKKARFHFLPSLAHLFNESFASPCNSVEKQALGR